MNHPSPFDKNGLQFAWDQTSINLAQTCLLKYNYTMIEGWRKRGLGIHLKFGQHYATALEHYYKHVALGMEKDEALREVVREALRDTWEREEGKPWDSGHTSKTRENLIRTIIWYVDHFIEDPTTVLLRSDGKPAVEYSFRLSVDNGIIFTGHIDRVVTYSNDPYVMDQKTTVQTTGPYYFRQFEHPNTQMGMYTWAGQVIYNIPVKGVIIDAAQIAVGFSRFQRGFANRTADQLEEWYETSMFWIEQARTATRERHFPMNPKSCEDYGGCEFRDVCARQKAVRPNFLKADFEVRHWNPLESR